MLLTIHPGIVIAVLVIAAALIFVLVQRNSNAKTARQQDERRYIDELSANLRNAMQTCTDPELKKQISDLLDCAGASPTRSNERAAALEQNAVAASLQLFAAVSTGDREEIRIQVEEVRRICAMRNNALRG